MKFRTGGIRNRLAIAAFYAEYERLQIAATEDHVNLRPHSDDAVERLCQWCALGKAGASPGAIQDCAYAFLRLHQPA